MTPLHPTIRIALVLILAPILMQGNIGVLLAAGASVALARGYALKHPLRGCAAPLWRVRWLFLAILLMHLWLPQAPSSGVPGAWFEPLRNILALAVLVLAADTLRAATASADLLRGLSWWLRPLRYLGLPAERFADRLWLTMELIPRQQEALSRLASAARPWSARLFSDLLQGAGPDVAALPLQERIAPGEVAGPPLRQWLWPLLLLVLLAAAGQYRW